MMGTVVWEGSGPNREFVSCSAGFHHEVGRATAGQILIVCDDCDDIQPD